MFIPLKDDNPTDKIPFVTIVIIVINAVVYIYEFSLGPGLEMFVYRMGAIPYELTHFIDAEPLSPVPVHLTLATSLFLHGDVFHILGNILYFWIFGNNIECALGHFRFIIFYMLCGLAASILHIALNVNSTMPMVGASGAIAGILGGYIVLYPRARVLVFIWLIIFIRTIWVPSFVVLGLWFIGQIYSAGLGVGGVAWFAHIGGFVAGFLLIRVFEKDRVGSYKILW